MNSGDHSYVFSSSTVTSQVEVSGSRIRLTDSLLSGDVPLSDGIGLGRVFFEVAPDVSGTFSVIVYLGVDATSLRDEFNDELSFEIANGQITIQ